MVPTAQLTKEPSQIISPTSSCRRSLTALLVDPYSLGQPREVADDHNSTYHEQASRRCIKIPEIPHPAPWDPCCTRSIPERRLSPRIPKIPSNRATLLPTCPKLCQHHRPRHALPRWLPVAATPHACHCLRLLPYPSISSSRRVLSNSLPGLSSASRRLPPGSQSHRPTRIEFDCLQISLSANPGSAENVIPRPLEPWVPKYLT